MLNSFLYTISCITLILFTGLLFNYLDTLFTNKTNIFYKKFSIISLLVICSLLLIDILTSDEETCLFPRWCHEGIDDQIVPSFYFYQMNKCPRYSSWLTGDYSEYDENHNDKCEISEYGCCEIWDIECSSAYRAGDTYSDYQFIRNRNISHWTLGINKLDEEGSNCPTIEELIYRVSKNDRDSYLLVYLSYTITAMIIMSLCMICRMCTKKDDYEKTDSDDVEKAKFVLKESV
jgi:hypothetical protein